MQFNSVKGSNFTSAAKSLNKSTAAIFDASRTSAPDFTGISKQSIVSRTKERNAATEAKGLVERTNIKADSLIDRTKLKIKTEKDVADIKRPAKRMAGVVAGLGTIATGYMMGQGNKEDAAEQAKRDAAFDERTKALRDLVNKPPAVYKSTPYVGPEAPTFKTPGSTTPEPSTSEGTTSMPLSGTGEGWSPFGKTIQFAEGTYKKDGTTGYNVGYGGNTISDLSKHPDTVWHTDSGSSAAAGAYQFMPSTWKETASTLGLKDFSPKSQESAGKYLAESKGVNPNKMYKTRAGLKEAFHKLSPTWAGLPNNNNVSHYEGYNGNNSMNFDSLVSFYEKQVGYKLK